MPTNIDADSDDLQQALADQKKMVAELQRTGAAVGDVISLMMQSGNYKDFTLGQVQSLVVPAVWSGNFSMTYAASKDASVKIPVAAVLWASVSDEVDARLSQGAEWLYVVNKTEWNSGSNPWIIMTVGETTVVRTMLRKLCSDKFKQLRPKTWTTENGLPELKLIQY